MVRLLYHLSFSLMLIPINTMMMVYRSTMQLQIYCHLVYFIDSLFSSICSLGGGGGSMRCNLMQQHAPHCHRPGATTICWTARSMERSIFFFLKKYCSAPGERNCPNFFSRGVFPSYYHVISDFCLRKVWFFAPGCLNNCGQGWSFSVILAWDNQKGTFWTQCDKNHL